MQNACLYKSCVRGDRETETETETETGRETEEREREDMNGKR